VGGACCAEPLSLRNFGDGRLEAGRMDRHIAKVAEQEATIFRAFGLVALDADEVAIQCARARSEVAATAHVAFVLRELAQAVLDIFKGEFTVLDVVERES